MKSFNPRWPFFFRLSLCYFYRFVLKSCKTHDLIVSHTFLHHDKVLFSFLDFNLIRGLIDVYDLFLIQVTKRIGCPFHVYYFFFSCLTTSYSIEQHPVQNLTV